MYKYKKCSKIVMGLTLSASGCLLPFTSIAQTNTFPFPSTGNVGIGTTNPTAPLTVYAGSANLDPSLIYGAPAMFSLGGASVELAGGVESKTPWSYWLQTRQTQNMAWPLALNPLGGNVGIGTLNPTASFTLDAGAANLDPSLSYGAPAAVSLRSASVELAEGVASTTPWAYWLQARQTQNTAWTLSLNPLGGNVGIGTTSPQAKLEINGNLKLTANSGASIAFADGTTQSTAWNGTLCGGDYAESVDISGDRAKYEPGDVLVLSEGEGADVMKSFQPYSTLVAGVYSTKPGVLGRRQVAEKTQQEIPMAMVGIVPTKVSAESGPIKKGDLLVTSSTAGYAMKGTDPSRMFGAVVGKAMGNLDSGTGVIEVLVSLQ